MTMPSQKELEAAESLKSCGNAQRAAGNLAAAVESYRSALRTLPDHAPSLYNLGLALCELGRPQDAERCFRRVVELDAHDADALFHLGSLLTERGELAEASQALRAALQETPQNAHLWLYLGIAAARQSALEEALASLRRAVELAPTLANAHFNLGNVHSLLGARDEALTCYRFAHKAEPGNPIYADTLLFEMQHTCDWSGLEPLCELRRRSVREHPEQPVNPFCLLSIPSSRAEQLKCASNFAADLARAAARDRARLGFGFKRGARERLTIGYVSADLHEHATAYLAAELFELHDRSRFRVHAYSYGPDDGSPMRARLQCGFDRFVDVARDSDAEAARRIHADGVDILVDLKGYTQGARTGITALRPAPVQVSFLGYPGTMGADFIDYLVCDAVVIPPQHGREYSEKLAVLPASYQVNDRRRALAETPSRRELHLPEHAFVFCCFNQGYKILPDVFAVWMRLLKSVPGSVLWLLEWNRWAVANLQRAAAAAGVDPVRLVFAPKWPLARHLARLSAADLFLDTLPYNAHTTASDALWAGLPVLTCAGESFVARVAASLLAAVGLPELVTGSLAEYEAAALRFARDPDALSGLRAKLARNRASAALFDTPRFVRDLESAYEAMWNAYADGLAVQA